MTRGSTPFDLGRRLREFDEFFALPELSDSPPERRCEAMAELRRTGTYTHTVDEILIGAQPGATTRAAWAASSGKRWRWSTPGT
ncbi:hypothetical protein ACFXK0_10960 [Nocardia sp. NPDC059177]|uniref:hypothetical protein n=1 Tax=Nocardia sp. NPDC059177 TaxID=3346759 RepID=UPI0036CD5BF6